MNYFIILLIFACFCWFFNLLYRIIKNVAHQFTLYRKMQHIPGPPFFFFIKRAILLWHTSSDSCKDAAKKLLQETTKDCQVYGKNGFYKIWIPFVSMIVVYDSKLTLKILNSSVCQNKAHIYELIGKITGNRLLTCDDRKAKEIKKLYMKHFSPNALMSYIVKSKLKQSSLRDQIDQCIQNCNGKLKLKILISTYVLDTVGENLFSTSFNSLQAGKEPEFIKAGDRFLESLNHTSFELWKLAFSNQAWYYLVSIFDWKLFSDTIPRIRNVQMFKDTAQKLIRDRQKTIKDGNQYMQMSLLDSIIFNMHKNTLNSMDAVCDVVTFFLTAYDTTTTTATWLIYFLARHGDVQEKLKTEIDLFFRELKSSGEQVDFHTLKRLDYMDSCIKETMRLAPLAPFIGRKPNNDIQIMEGIVIPRDVSIICHVQHIHQKEEYFYQPERFLPERFQINDKTHSKVHPWYTSGAFFPFSSGSRSCVGREYAMSQLKLLLLTLIGNYTFEIIDHDLDISCANSIIQRPAQFDLIFKNRLQLI